MFKNKNLLIIALIMLVNSLGYGIIIPIIYTYSMKFGLTDFQNGMLFAIFSLCTFISTPFIGRLSDKYGRRPLLIGSLIGTAVSFFMAAFAPSAFWLFFARALDGITAGNVPVASAVISDSTEPKDRAKGFGIIYAAFGFGFVFGPAISAFTAPYGLHIPFIIAGAITVLSVLITLFFLPETNAHMGEVKKGKIFDFAKLFHSLFDKNVGPTFLISFIYSFAFGLFIFAFQPFSVKILQLTANEIASIFVIFGVIGFLSQSLFIPRVVKTLGERNALTYSFMATTIGFFGLFLARNLPFFIVASVFFSLFNSFVMPLVQTVLSKETDEKSQGTVQGLNASYISLGNILGPLAGGLIATYYIPLPFALGGIFSLICLYLAVRFLKENITHKESAF